MRPAASLPDNHMENDERKRSHLRLVVNNKDKRKPVPESAEPILPLEELSARRDEFRDQFYEGMDPGRERAYRSLEVLIGARKWQYGLDPLHNRVLVLPAEAVAPEAVPYGVAPQDEVLLFVAEDMTGEGYCLSAEMILPFACEDDAVMEEALLYGVPVLQYGAVFLEENPQDGFLDLIYRLAFPVFPPELDPRLFDRFIGIASVELSDTIRALSE